LEESVQPADPAGHLSGEDVAAYLDRAVAETDRARIEEHLAECGVCRLEVVDVHRVLRKHSLTRRWVRGIGIAAAAAALLLVFGPLALRQETGPTYREPPVTTAAAPTPLAPRGAVTAVSPLTWSAVPRADRYRVRVYDAAGNIMWEAETPDTATAVPEAVSLVAGEAYYWKVEARTGVDRWAASDLTRFTIGPARE
jgi:putative zinc finger protein